MLPEPLLLEPEPSRISIAIAHKPAYTIPLPNAASRSKLIKAAIDYNPNKAVGLDGALAKIAHASYGPFLLGIVAAGLIAFGVYSLSDARYRRL